MTVVDGAQGIRVAHGIRTVTDSEVDFYRTHGWAKLGQLVSAEIAAEMLVRAKSQMSSVLSTGTGTNTSTSTGARMKCFEVWLSPARVDQEEPFRSVTYSSTMGHNAHRLISRDTSVRLFSDKVICKIPVGAHNASVETPWHQDLPSYPFDRIGNVTFWIALDEVTPEQGSLRFLDYSHQSGPLGRVSSEDDSLFHQHEYLPDLYDMSPPLHLQPGDATVHNGLVVHGAAENQTDRLRWSFVANYIPGDTRYTGAAFFKTDGLGLKPEQQFDHPNFPIVFPGKSACPNG
jgi:ectoine hydroxylase-related dioxygenase (phytanoyl-CoA dioxygenase family)